MLIQVIFCRRLISNSFVINSSFKVYVLSSHQLFTMNVQVVVLCLLGWLILPFIKMFRSEDRMWTNPYLCVFVCTVIVNIFFSVELVVVHRVLYIILLKILPLYNVVVCIIFMQATMWFAVLQTTSYGIPLTLRPLCKIAEPTQNNISYCLGSLTSLWNLRHEKFLYVYKF